LGIIGAHRGKKEKEGAVSSQNNGGGSQKSENYRNIHSGGKEKEALSVSIEEGAEYVSKELIGEDCRSPNHKAVP